MLYWLCVFIKFVYSVKYSANPNPKLGFASFPCMFSYRLGFSLSFSSFLFFFFFIFILKNFWPHWVFVAVRGLSLVAVSGGYSSLQCKDFSLQWLLLLLSKGSRRTGFSSCGAQALLLHTAYGIFSDQGSNLYPLH